jgi:2-polyprenyl-3-methyl-5-hydroxy-6-metoxy-1,4-benzoquinol methylase
MLAEIAQGSSRDQLHRMMRRFQTNNLKNIAAGEFRSKIDEFLNLVDHEMEGIIDPSKQRDLTIRFHWGHNHDFGEFSLPGRMGDRHIWLLSEFMDRFKVLPSDLTGKSVFDVGCWTGGTSLLLGALGASVYAIDEVRKYVGCLNYLAHAFGMEAISAHHRSLYQCTTPELQDRFDYVLFAGVLYHVTDPILALRIVFNTLKDGGTCLLETYGIDNSVPMLNYQGPSFTNAGTRGELNRNGWNWFVPSSMALEMMMRDVGFEDVQVSEIVGDHRLLAVGTRKRHVDMCRAGLSVVDIR